MKRTIDTRVLSNTWLSNDYFVLELSMDHSPAGIKPGQFVQVRVDNSPGTFLRRPISVYDINIERNSIRLLIKIAGAGTAALNGLKKGDKLNIITPLGNSFTIPAKGSKALLVGGGVGVAPLYLLGKKLKEMGIQFSFLLGYRSASHIIEPERFKELGELLITTDDGSAGHRGMVISHPELSSGNYSNIYCCGPDIMMKSVASIASSRGIDCEVSLENMMACGIGICLCCIEETTRGNVNTCTEGPVFNIKELKWQT